MSFVCGSVIPLGTEISQNKKENRDQLVLICIRIYKFVNKCSKGHLQFDFKNCIRESAVATKNYKTCINTLQFFHQIVSRNS